jgi:GC-rich sequence DNA-binding factor
LERLEDEHVSILKERSDMISRRRCADDEDDLSIVFGSLTLIRPEIEELDELGRTISSVNPAATKSERGASRVARRLRRRAMGAQTQHDDVDEGYSTDSSLPPSDAMDYSTAMLKLKLESRDILSDVRAIEFKDPKQGLGKWFGEWRDRFGESYTSAWGGLGLVGAWEFWVRLELVGWNPLEVSYSK